MRGKSLNVFANKPIFILAGGFGTRLRVTVPNLPKPLAPVQGVPFLVRLLDNLVRQQATRFIFLLHYKADEIQKVVEDYLTKNPNLNLDFKFLVEDEPLGTGGSIINAINLLGIQDSFLVVNGDTWLTNGLNILSNSSPNTLASVKIDNGSRYGSLIFEGDKIINFNEKKNIFQRTYINAGMYHFNPDIFNHFSNLRIVSLEQQILPFLAARRKLKFVLLETDFIDIGMPEDYYRFDTWVKNGILDEF